MNLPPNHPHYQEPKKSPFAEMAAMAVVGVVGIVLVGAILFGIVYTYRHYKIWGVEMAGKALEIEREYQGRAILAEAEHARQSRVMAARAEEEAAQHTANAIKIVGEMAQKYPEYRQQEFFMGLSDALTSGDIDQIIYLPTEAGLPITEAGARK